MRSYSVRIYKNTKDTRNALVNMFHASSYNDKLSVLRGIKSIDSFATITNLRGTLDNISIYKSAVDMIYNQEKSKMNSNLNLLEIFRTVKGYYNTIYKILDDLSVPMSYAPSSSSSFIEKINGLIGYLEIFKDYMNREGRFVKLRNGIKEKIYITKTGLSGTYVYTKKDYPSLSNIVENSKLSATTEPISFADYILGNIKSTIKELRLIIDNAITYNKPKDSANYIELPIVNFEINRDLHSIMHTIQINDILITDNVLGIGRYDCVEVLYQDDGLPSQIMFKGFIDDSAISLGKNGEYLTIRASGNLSVLNRTPLPYSIQNKDFLSWIKKALEISGEDIKIETYGLNNFNIKNISDVNKAGNIKEKIDYIRDNYPVYITETNTGAMRLFSPYYLYDQTSNVKTDFETSTFNSALASLNNEINYTIREINKKKIDPSKLDKNNNYVSYYVLDRIHPKLRNKLIGILNSFYDIAKDNRSDVVSQLKKYEKIFSSYVDTRVKPANPNEPIYSPQTAYANSIKRADEGIYNRMLVTKDKMLHYIDYISHYNSKPNELGVSQANLKRDINDFSKTTSLKVWNLDYKTNLPEVHISGMMGNINCVFVLGMNSINEDNLTEEDEGKVGYPFGVAIDIYEVLVNNKKIVPLIIRRYDIADNVTLNQEAAKQLLENKNNYVVNCELPDVYPLMNVGDYVVINNVPSIPGSSNNKIYKGVVFIVENLKHVVNSSNTSTSVTLRANQLEAIPQGLLTGEDAKSLGLLSKDYIFNYLGNIESTGGA